MNLVPFILYGLLGCPHCLEAEQYLKKAGVPFASIVANEDPIIEEGIKKITSSEAAHYPVLLYKPTKELIVEYKAEEYERLVKAFYSFLSANAPSSFGGSQPNLAQIPQQA